MTKLPPNLSKLGTVPTNDAASIRITFSFSFFLFFFLFFLLGPGAQRLRCGRVYADREEQMLMRRMGVYADNSEIRNYYYYYYYLSALYGGKSSYCALKFFRTRISILSYHKNSVESCFYFLFFSFLFLEKLKFKYVFSISLSYYYTSLQTLFYHTNFTQK